MIGTEIVARQDIEAALRYLWGDQDIYPERYAKAASAFAALARIVEEERPLGGEEGEFLALYGRCMDAEEDILANLWLEPAVFAWTVYTYNCVGLLLDRDASRAAGSAVDEEDYAHIRSLLLAQFEYFKAFVLAIARAAGEDCGLDSPLRVQTPFTFPGTGLLLLGDGEAVVTGLRQGMPLLLEGGRERRPAMNGDNPDASAFRLEQVPLLTWKQCHCYLNPWVGPIPGMQFPEVDHAHANPFPVDDEHMELFRQALDIVERFAPGAFEEFRKWIRCIATKVPRPIGSGGVGSAAFTFLPGVIFLKVPPNPVWIAESMVHECYHQRLFFVDEDTPILKEIPGPEDYYSPWRFDKRPPHGLLHAVTVFIPVTRFFLRLYESGEFQGADQDYAMSFVVRQRYQLQIGADVLERFGDFTEAGKLLFAAIRHDLAALVDEIEHAGLPADCPALIIDRGFATGQFMPTLSRVDRRPLSVLELLIEDIGLSGAGEQAAQWKRFLEDRLGNLEAGSA